MPLKVAQVPRTLASMWEMLTQLQREVRELRAARTLENATIGGGQGLTIQLGGTGPSIRATANAQGVGFLTSQQAALLISSGDATEVAPGIFTAQVDSNGVPSMFMICPDVNGGTAYMQLQGGVPDQVGPNWSVAAGASSLQMDYNHLALVLGDGTQLTVDYSGVYFTSEYWQTPTLANGWTAYGSTFQPPVFQKLATGMVQWAGVIAPGTVTNGTTVATMPAAYTPNADHPFRVSGGAGAYADVYVRNTGALQIQNTSGTITWLSLSGISYPV